MSEPLTGMDADKRLQRLEQRLARMEARPAAGFLRIHPAWPFLLGAASIVPGYLGLGFPEHYYHLLFSGLLLLLLYHRGSLRMAVGRWRWPQVLLNFLVLCLLFKFLIGGGISHPFDWFKLPAIVKTPPPIDPSWYTTFVPDYTVQWQGVPKLSNWSIDVTKIQTILLLATFAGVPLRALWFDHGAGAAPHLFPDVSSVQLGPGYPVPDPRQCFSLSPVGGRHVRQRTIPRLGIPRAPAGGAPLNSRGRVKWKDLRIFGKIP